MMKALVVVCVLVLIVIPHVTTIVVVEASHHLPFLIKPRDLAAPFYVTISGCNNNCDGACCYCDIRKHTPVCLKCCEEDP
ncbi:hypothetical protein ACHQM5_020046 [Ranunculus cassubicifolius]